MSQETSNDGVLEKIDGGYRIRFERQLNHPIDKVWAAISDPEGMRGWLAAATEFEPHDGGAIALRWQNTDLEGNHAVARGHITEFVPPTTIEYDTDIHGLIRWELEPRGSNCLLRLTVSHNLPDEYRSIVLAGWHVHIDFLEDTLEGRSIDWEEWPIDRWEVHHRRYEARITALEDAVLS